MKMFRRTKVSAVALVVATLGVLAIGWLDRTLQGAGHDDAHLFLLHLLPIGLISWYLGQVEGAVVAGLATLVVLAGARFGVTPFGLVWNAGATAVCFFGLNWLLGKLQDTTEESRHLAETDTMTGVLNRRGFWSAADRELRRAQRYNMPLTVAYLDLDNFKMVNDTQGHPAGDALLILVAQTLQQAMRTVDAVARLGGDEFALLLPHTSREAAAMVAVKVQKMIHEAMQRYKWPVTVSIGLITVDRPSPMMSIDDLLRQADVAMYQAKSAGKNRIVVERDEYVTAASLN